MRRPGLGLSGSEWGQLAVICECDKDDSGSKTFGEFLDKLKTCQLLKTLLPGVSCMSAALFGASPNSAVDINQV